MTKELNNRIKATENFSTDLVHEIRNPLASLKSASEIISEIHFGAFQVFRRKVASVKATDAYFQFSDRSEGQ